jgi:periplasmic divalent cation tolerance protein
MSESERQSFLVVLLSVTPEKAEEISQRLVDERLVACVNLLPAVTSIFRWKGAVERATETLCILKTTRALFERLRARVLELHPYELPELIALEISEGHPPYLAWLWDSVG